MTSLESRATAPAVPHRDRHDEDMAGTTQIADAAAARIAALAARRVPGVHTLGAGTPRAIGAIREAVGADDTRSGVRVELGSRQIAVDIVLVAEFGEPLRETAELVRAAVHHDVERLVGLQVTEVNVEIADVHVPDRHLARAERPDLV
ncbi:hypothetical protein GCM10011512_23760 [Tersicoccus solisilvae]|uniref:Asp23/Gls24 family envelope stress response protein n=1 Tax=Tersicoccus solisilvae TaxID=1882339 RepID=A0ABQ1PF61_9MICC|nr:Asp23/Gls24 family envelope stress response protein [Tersicoccus solisilvae]GGC95998.1 hypothetical protein GCM10011512_23760 [Tersicoccus solisilvae]